MDEEEYIEIQDLNEATSVNEGDELIIHQTDGQDRRVKLENVKTGSAAEADHAVAADNATEAEHADTATEANHADKATSADAATAADYATEAGKATNDSEGNSIKDTYAKKSGDSFTGPVSINGDLEVEGNIIQRGEAYETHAEKVYTKNDEIITRDGAVAGLAADEYTGIRAKKYDGTNDGLLVFDKNGEARVGDEGDTQPLLTRDESSNMKDGESVVWDATNKRVKKGSGTELSAIPLEDATYNGNLLGTNDIREMLEVENYWYYLGYDSNIKHFTCIDSVAQRHGILTKYHFGEIMAIAFFTDGTILKLGYNDTDWTKVGSDAGGSGASPIGAVIPYSGATAPAGFLLCDGSEYNQADYPDLYNVLKNIPECQSTVSGKFKVYDLRESTIVGAGTNTTKTIAEHDTYTVGQFKDDQLQGHKHDDEGHTHSSAGGSYKTGSGSYYSLATVGYNTGTGYAKLGGPTELTGNGTPRYGTTTHGKQTGLNFIIKATQTKDDLDTTIDDSKTDVGHAWSGSKVNTEIHNAGKTYVVTPTRSTSYSLITINDTVELVTGNVMKIFLTGDYRGSSTSATSCTAYIKATNWSSNKNIKVYQNGSKINLPAHKIDTYMRLAQTGTTLELVYDGTDWVVMGNPIVLSQHGTDNSYSVYSDGLIELDLHLTADSNAWTIYNLPITFSDENYHIAATVRNKTQSAVSAANYVPCIYHISGSQVYLPLYSAYYHDMSIRGY